MIPGVRITCARIFVASRFVVLSTSYKVYHRWLQESATLGCRDQCCKLPDHHGPGLLFILWLPQKLPLDPE